MGNLWRGKGRSNRTILVFANEASSTTTYYCAHANDIYSSPSVSFDTRTLPGSPFFATNLLSTCRTLTCLGQTTFEKCFTPRTDRSDRSLSRSSEPLTRRCETLCRICAAQIQPRNHVPDHAHYTAPTRQHELDHNKSGVHLKDLPVDHFKWDR